MKKYDANKKTALRKYAVSDVKQQQRAKTKAKFQSLAKRISQQLTGSSIYAVSQVGKSRLGHRRLFWSLIVVTGFCGALYGISRILGLYFRYPVNVNVRLEMDVRPQFPAVTVCNLNRMMSSYNRCLNESVNERFCRFGGMNPFDEVALVMSERRGMRACVNGSFGSYDAKEENFMQFLSAYYKMGPVKRMYAGHPQFSSVIHCAFNGKTCYYKHFDFHSDLHYGNCFTFRADKMEVNPNVSNPAVNVLELYWNVYPSEYIKFSETVGIRVVVHEKDDHPNIEENGINVSPGFETSIYLKEVMYKRMKPPYKDHCHDYSNGTAKNQNQCIRSCIQKLVNATCGCVFVGFFDLKGTRGCNLSNATETCCLDKTVENLASRGERCVCPLPCSSTHFKEQVSRARWPSKVFHRIGRETFYWLAWSMGTIVLMEENGLDTKGKEIVLFRNDWAKVRVLHSGAEKRVIEQSATFHDSELFSYLGGELGLWLGLSLATLFEVMELVMRMAKFLCRKVCRCSKCRPKESGLVGETFSRH